MTSCPGCPLLETSYEAQLEQKLRKLTRALDAYPRLAGAGPEGVQASDEVLGYRNRARMVVRSDANAPSELLGFYEENTRKVVPVRHCPAHHASLEAVLDVLRPLLFHDQVLCAFTRFVDVRATAGHAAADEAAILTLAGDLEDSDALAQLEERASALHEKLAGALAPLEVSTHLNVARSQNQAVLSGEQRVICGQRCLEFEVSGERFRVSPGAFFQINLDQLERVHGRMRELLSDEPERLVDLYCGVGVHGIALASPSTRLLGTDVSTAAIELAEENAQMSDISGVFKAMPDTEVAGWLVENLDGEPHELITNPARAGMSPETVALIGRIRPERVLYLSCDPRTLSRDLDRLGERGYRLAGIEAFDFMPQTDQVETLVTLVAGDEPAQLSRERAFQPEEPADRHFSMGVSGPSAAVEKATRTVWIAAVSGHTPGHGFLPHADLASSGSADQERIRIDRLRKVESNSVVRIHATTTSDDEIRRRLRAWDHPALGDPDYGDRQANHLAGRHANLDRIALHCVAAEIDGQWQRAEVPGQFLGLMRLPRKVLNTLPSPT